MAVIRQPVTVREKAKESVRPKEDQNYWGLLWVLPAFLALLFVMMFPILYAAWLSLYDKLGLSPRKFWVGLDNYAEHLTSPDFWHAVRVGAIYALGSVVMQLVVGLVVALLVNQTFRGRGFARAIVLLPYMIPTATMALVFAFMFNDLYGIVNKLLVSWGVLDEPTLFLGDLKWALPTVILAATWKWTPFVVIVLLARLQTIDPGLYECAKVEGSGPWAAFRDITLPSLRAAIFLVVLLRSIWMFNKFDIPYLLTAGGPLERTTNLPIYAYDVSFVQGKQGDGSALAVLMSLFLLAFGLVYFYVFKPEREVAVE